MKYTKPALTFDEQADQLISRGMAGDRSTIVSRLASVNYYRLSAYWLPFRQPGTEDFLVGTSISEVWNRYVFDRRLRLLVMDAVERIEVAVRTRLAYLHAHKYGPFGYCENRESLPNLDSEPLHRFYESIRKANEVGRKNEPFVDHFFNKYGKKHKFLPVWMATEVMTFGKVVSFFNGSSDTIRQDVSSVFSMPRRVFATWLLTLNMVRNICAHHGRLWNRKLGLKPMIPLARKHPDWHDPVSVQNDRVFCVLTILLYCVRIVAPQSSWGDRFRQLLATHPKVPVSNMGFPSEWEKILIWSE